MLLISFFFEFYPDIIRAGKLYYLNSPLYIIRSTKTTEYAFTEEEMQKRITKELPKNTTYSRMKGLGELTPKTLGEFAFGSNQKLVQLKMEDEEEVNRKLEIYLGQDGSQRGDLVKGYNN